MARQSVQSFFLLFSCIIVLSRAWAPTSLSRRTLARHLRVSSEEDHWEDVSEGKTSLSWTRRGFLATVSFAIGVMGSTPSVLAGTESAESSGKTIYKSGKTPIVPGGKPKDKSDLKGTRKDPDFLRSVADCRNACQNTPGSDGYARSKEDCLSECQDICCKTYEQCTFDIVPRI